jgi:hypothetical protein
MNATLALSDEEFISAFEACRVPEGLPHLAHVRLAWLSIRRLGTTEAVERVVTGIHRFALADGAIEKFHETMTRAWVYLIADAMRQNPAGDFDAFIRGCPDLLDKDLLVRHYRPLTLERGRSGWIPPDLETIPGAPAPRRR